MLLDRVSNPGPLTYESGALPIALRGPANMSHLSIHAKPENLLQSSHHQYPHLKSYTCVLLLLVTGKTERPGPEVMKLFSCSTQLSMKFSMLTSIKILRIQLFHAHISLKWHFLMLKCQQLFNIYEHENFHAQLN